MLSIVLKVVISSVIIVAVGEISNRYPRLGALLLTLPLVSILAFIMSWTRDHNLASVSRLSRETLILVPLGLPFFLPLAFAERLGIGFWVAFTLGVLLASTAIIAWHILSPVP